MKEPISKQEPILKQKSIEIKITVTPDNQLLVTGFPKNLQVSMDYMAKATQAIVNFFMQKAVDGEIDAEPSRIIKAHMMPPSKLIH